MNCTAAAMSAPDQRNIAEIERLIQHAGRISDQAEHDALMEQSYALLLPLVQKQVPAAQYLYACHFLSREGKRAEDAARRYQELVRAAARGAHAAAQFRLGQMLDDGGELDHDPGQSAYWFRLAAEQGDPYAQWVHGLNLLFGRGLQKDEALGLQFIERAAAGKFEGALKFLADAYATGAHGYSRDETKAEFFRVRMLDVDVIGY